MNFVRISRHFRNPHKAKGGNYVAPVRLLHQRLDEQLSIMAKPFPKPASSIELMPF